MEKPLFNMDVIREILQSDLFLDVPFLPGEAIQLLDKTTNGAVCLTNFRLIFYCKQQTNMTAIPIFTIRAAYISADLKFLVINTKLGNTFKCKYSNLVSCGALIKHLNEIADAPIDLPSVYASRLRDTLMSCFKEHPFLYSPKKILGLNDNDMTIEAALVTHEFTRMGFGDAWKITDVNSNFTTCSSYPKYHIMPRDISDKDIPYMASFRSHNRFPTVVWRSPKTGAVLIRCAQPCVGIMYSRNEVDERFVVAVLDNCKTDRIVKPALEGPYFLNIIDARYYSSAMLNRLRGGGFEYMEYYGQSFIRFMELPNLHAVRDSFKKLIALYNKTDNCWYTGLESTMWLGFISQLLKSASEIAIELDAYGRPAMVHCTDGWDRTPQLTSLAKLLLDPYYRTIKGFRILVVREWLQFGHKFGDRCGHSTQQCGYEEQSPIFLQWLDCVRQIQFQFPSLFEFNEQFLIKLAIHTYSGLFGTFFCNSESERQEKQCASRTCSVWSFLDGKFKTFRNCLYDPKDEVVVPSHRLRRLVVWDGLYEHALFPSDCNPLDDLTQPPRNARDAALCSALQPLPSIDVPPTFHPPVLPATAPASTTSEEPDDRNSIPIESEDSPLAHSMPPPNSQAATTVGEGGCVVGGGKLEVPGGLSRSYSDLSSSLPQLQAATADSEEDAPPSNMLRGHTRGGSDPQEFSTTTREFRLCSLKDNDTLVIHSDEDQCGGGLPKVDDDDDDDDAFPAIGVPVDLSVVSKCVLARSDQSQSQLGQSLYCHPLGYDECLDFDNAQKTWSEGYFCQPTFSDSFLECISPSIASYANSQHPQDSTFFDGESTAYSDTLGRSRSHTESELQENHGDVLRRIATSSCETKQSPSPPVNSRRASDMLAQLNGATEARPFEVSENSLPCDLDGFPRRIDPIACKIYSEEVRVQSEQRSQIDRLTADLNANREEVTALSQEVARLRYIIYSSQFEQPNSFNVGVEATDARSFIVEEEDEEGAEDEASQYTNRNGVEVSADCEKSTRGAMNGNARETALSSSFSSDNHPSFNQSSIVEAIRDAMGMSNSISFSAEQPPAHNRGASGSTDYFAGPTTTSCNPATIMTQSLTDEMLLNLADDSFADDETPVHSTNGFCATTFPRRRKGTTSICSDVISTFDVVDRSAIPEGGDTLFCGNCSHPMDGISPPPTCRVCCRHFCGACSGNLQRTRDTSICTTCLHTQRQPLPLIPRANPPPPSLQNGTFPASSQSWVHRGYPQPTAPASTPPRGSDGSSDETDEQTQHQPMRACRPLAKCSKLSSCRTCGSGGRGQDETAIA